jgi:hypothetical protein
MLSDERIEVIQNKTMKNKTLDELNKILNGSSGTNWEPEAVEAARRELQIRTSANVGIPQSNPDQPSGMGLNSSGEAVVLLRQILNLQLEQNKLLKNISTAATLFTILMILGLIGAGCSLILR